jgi:hypothetical protein
MARFYITHANKHGERHQLSGTWEASTPEEALSMMFVETGAEDDGNWAAWLVTSPDDIIR